MRILDRNPSLQMASQSSLDCSEAAGDVSSIYSTPNASSAFAMAILVLVSKNAFANCSPSEKKNKKRNRFFGQDRWRRTTHDKNHTHLATYSR